MKLDLIDKLFNEFERDKKVIAKNLIMVMNTIILEAKDEFGKVKMIITYERNDENETNTNNN